VDDARGSEGGACCCDVMRARARTHTHTHTHKHTNTHTHILCITKCVSHHPSAHSPTLTILFCAVPCSCPHRSLQDYYIVQLVDQDRLSTRKAFVSVDCMTWAQVSMIRLSMARVMGVIEHLHAVYQCCRCERLPFALSKMSSCFWLSAPPLFSHR
jgi:hypothetical protein